MISNYILPDGSVVSEDKELEIFTEYMAKNKPFVIYSKLNGKFSDQATFVPERNQFQSVDVDDPRLEEAEFVLINDITTDDSTMETNLIKRGMNFHAVL